VDGTLSTTNFTFYDTDIVGILYYQSYLYISFSQKGFYKLSIDYFANPTNTKETALGGPIINNINISSSYNCIDNMGNLYINTSNNVLKFDATSKPLENGLHAYTTFIQNVSFTNILFYNNHFYVTDKNSNQISEYDKNGILVNSNYAVGGGPSGRGMAFDTKGNFYCSNENTIRVKNNQIINSENLSCFKKDTKILTVHGYQPIQNIRKNDLIKTSKDGYKRVVMIGKRNMFHPALQERIKDQLYTLSPEKYPEVFESLIITGCHSILVDNFKNDEERKRVIEINGNTNVTDNKYRVPACADILASVYESPGIYSIYHFALEHDDYYMNYGIYANGLLVETCSQRMLKELSNMTLID
jgi:hypothetical protein